MPLQSINLKFPFETSFYEVFSSNNISQQAILDDLTALMTTPRGKLMQPTCYSPVYDYLFQPLDSGTISSMETAIKNKVQEMIPEINITSIISTVNSGINPNMLTLVINFTITNLLNITQSLTLNYPISI